MDATDRVIRPDTVAEMLDVAARWLDTYDKIALELARRQGGPLDLGNQIQVDLRSLATVLRTYPNMDRTLWVQAFSRQAWLDRNRWFPYKSKEEMDAVSARYDSNRD